MRLPGMSHELVEPMDSKGDALPSDGQIKKPANQPPIRAGII